MAKRSRKLKGRQAFIEYYTEELGSSEQFTFLTTQLERKTKPVLVANQQTISSMRQLWQDRGLSWHPLSWYPLAIQWPDEIPFGSNLPGYIEHLFYPMNPSSLLPPLALEAQPGERILDACAAPGGKTLILAEAMKGQGNLQANDLSRARGQRLRDTLTNFGHPNIKVTTSDARTLFRSIDEAIDRILLDAPCSSEKHVWHSSRHLKDWSPGRIKQLSQRQFALLSGLWRCLKPGGRLVYSTCAMNRSENEEVIDAFLQRYGDEMQLIPFPLQNVPGNGDTTCRIQPDETFDPMFIAVLERKIDETP